jgi:hypothetical protein
MIKFGIKCIFHGGSKNESTNLWCKYLSGANIFSSLKEACQALDYWANGDPSSRYVIEPYND